jgi:hypothetical protein
MPRVSDDIRDIILRLIGPDGVSIEGILARAAHAGCPSEGPVRGILNGLVLDGSIFLDGMVYYPTEPAFDDNPAPYSQVPLAPESIVEISVTSGIKRSSVTSQEREYLHAMEVLLQNNFIRITSEGRLAITQLGSPTPAPG